VIPWGSIWALAFNTVRESVRNRVLYGLLFFSIAMIASGVIVSSLSYVEGARILQDVGLASIRLFGVAIAIFLGIHLIHKEVDRRTVFTILSKPISRGTFLVGKFAGLTLTVWLQTAIMGTAFVLVSLAAGAPVGFAHAAFLMLVAAELALVTAVATFFSAFTTPFLAAFFTAGTWAVGQLTRELRDIGQTSELASMEWMTWLVHRVLPDLAGFDLSVEAAHMLPIATSDVVLPLFYGVGYITVVMICAVGVFERRDFR